MSGQKKIFFLLFLNKQIIIINIHYITLKKTHTARKVQKKLMLEKKKYLIQTFRFMNKTHIANVRNIDFFLAELKQGYLIL